MFGGQVDKGDDPDPGDFLYVTFIALGDRVGQNRVDSQEHETHQYQERQGYPAKRLLG